MLGQVTVSLLGENPVSLDGLRRILVENNFNVLSSGGDVSALETLSDLVNPRCHLILVDSLVETRGIGVLDDIAGKIPLGLVIVLSDRFEYEVMMECFRHDVSAYIVKKISPDSLISYLNLVSVGEKVMPSDLTGILLSRMPSGNTMAHRNAIADAGLSPREEQILAGLVAGQPNKVISRHFLISEATVKVHVKAILRKIGVQNRTQAAIWAMGDRDDVGFTNAEAGSCSQPKLGNSHSPSEI